ncbi:MAG: plasmid stability protein [Gammaproteobacteria bacterium]|nr:plasmid stability protein [Gammaproteobacteria bacterium]MYE50678.1 plasmid stability protein [Gammaproteobacteria bacterium]
MPSITIEAIPPALHQRLKDAAKRHRRSLQNEIVACLERYVDQLPKSKSELLAEAAVLRNGLPSVNHDLVDQFKHAGRS